MINSLLTSFIMQSLPLRNPLLLFTLPLLHLEPTNSNSLPPSKLRSPTKRLLLSHRNFAKKWVVKACAAAGREIDMVRTEGGVYAAKPKKVVVLWDLDNKPPRGPPYQAAMALKKMARSFGELVDVSAYANRHAFIHLPHWVVEERRERRRLDFLERKGISTPAEPYVCSVCGRKCKTHLDLKKHFKQLHERERQKKLNRMRSLKGKKRHRFKERYIDGKEKYIEAANSLITPKIGYGLAPELKRAGVFVKTVQDKPQAADWAVKRQMQHSMNRGVDWLVLVSDDSDFSDMLRKAREANLGTVVVGDWDGALGRQADLWVPWSGVENGEIREEDLLLRKRRSEFDENTSDGFSASEFDGASATSAEGDLDVVNDLFERMEFNAARISAFSESEWSEEDWPSEGLGLKGNTELGVGNFTEEEDGEGDYLIDIAFGGEDDDMYF